MAWVLIIDPIPDADLHNLLRETGGALKFPQNIHENLSSVIPLRPDGLKYETEPKPAVQVRWVVRVSCYHD